MKSNANYGSLFIIPSRLGDQPPLEVLPLSIRKKINDIFHFVVENEKVTRRFIKKIVPGKTQSKLNFYILNKYTQDIEIPDFLNPCLEGNDIGLLSDAGCPGIADPGNQLVITAHDKNIKVIPLVGPSSIFLGLMASGLNGQNFAFNGYLPIDKKECKSKIKHLEKRSLSESQTQIVIETPYRNQQLFDVLIKTLSADTLLTVACDLSLSSEFVKTKTTEDWKKESIDIHKRQCIFIFQK
ncbi:MAG: SAM-dependent methyltransferase [Psychroflexus sp.]|jgi:16S rRNA (cytidine1402-2'-O)-methyltransferase|nr:SAM-dependent methyltransferase [Psychroflexus sp.]